MGWHGVWCQSQPRPVAVEGTALATAMESGRTLRHSQRYLPSGKQGKKKLKLVFVTENTFISIRTYVCIYIYQQSTNNFSIAFAFFVTEKKSLKHLHILQVHTLIILSFSECTESDIYTPIGIL